MVQALGQTHVSSDSPRINSENLLVLLAPLVFIYGAALFHTLLDQLDLPPVDARGAAVAGFVAILCAPLLFALLAAPMRRRTRLIRRCTFNKRPA